MLDDIHACLDALKLRKMRELVEAELKSAQAKKTSYSALLLGLLRQEVEDKRQRSVQSRINQASLPDRWTLETYPFHVQTCISKKQHQELAELDFIARAENVVWMGGTGVGKTGLLRRFCSRLFTPGARASSSKPRTSSTSFRPASLIARRRLCSSASRAWTCCSSTSSATSNLSPARSTTSSASSRIATARNRH